MAIGRIMVATIMHLKKFTTFCQDVCVETRSVCVTGQMHGGLVGLENLKFEVCVDVCLEDVCVCVNFFMCKKYLCTMFMCVCVCVCVWRVASTCVE